MNPVTALFRRSRSFRLFFYLSMVVLWALIAFISFGSLEKYSYVGNMVLLAAVIFFALWAWWYGEDRDRRRAARAAAQNGEPNSADGNGHLSARR